VVTAAGLVVTGLSHLGVGLDGRGDFRGLVRFAVSGEPCRPARTVVIAYQRGALGRRLR
jgi:hypothetical protein